MDTPEYDTLLRTLVQIAAQQETINSDIRAVLVRQDTHLVRLDSAIARIDAAIERLDVTQARIETLLARLLPPRDNGREA